MTGETDLDRLLRSLEPVLDATEWGFATLPSGCEPPTSVRVRGMFEEAEGRSIIAPAADLAAAGVAHEAGLALISLAVHSSLAAVGLTARLSTALAGAGISANVVAAYHHDHVFVPWCRRDEALEILRALAAR